ncbi:hypothetical protein Leryth_005992 [Lithospermum erythrorhizon]|uniref:Oxidoreductase n=1 Tax=Lithospermum erythrorhizon TaxID=34254 RepID=A0AAV3NIR6_LITER|nr:hypothetical protein Leryth_005992 [Lithospermum erythrorhizon]
MQDALPYRASLPIYPQNNLSSSSTNYARGAKSDDLKEVVRGNAVIVLARRGCCMSHVVKILLQGLGVNPAIYEVDEQDENDAIRELVEKPLSGDRIQFPAVFIGGKFFGGLDRIMATHITGELTPVLKQAGALWL